MSTTGYKKRWVFIQFAAGEGWCKAFVRRTVEECGLDAYELHWEDGEIERVFVNSIFRIRFVQPKKGRVIDFEKRRLKRLRLVESGPGAKIDTCRKNKKSCPSPKSPSPKKSSKNGS